MLSSSDPFFRTLNRFFHNTESASSLLLGACTLLALLLANSHLASAYFCFLDSHLFGFSVQNWVNDGLMTIFFFYAGLEIKREITMGELSELRQAMLPVCAAVGGMMAPAVIYLLANLHQSSTDGWAIPMATDIAFALGVLNLLGKRVPSALKMFLLTLAIVDDLGAILIIAIFYTHEIQALGLYVAAASVAGILIARMSGFKTYPLYIALGALLWFGVFYSGVHATIAGVLLGLLTPNDFPLSRNSPARFSPLNHLIQKIQPWVGFAIMPIFALANAGIALTGLWTSVSSHSSISAGVFLGLTLGKPIGIMLTSLAVVSLRLASRPPELKWRYLLGASCLAGIGFTMAIFMTNLSFQAGDVIASKISIMAASFASALLGYTVLTLALDRKAKEA